MITLAEKKSRAETSVGASIAVLLLASAGLCFVAGLIARVLYLCAWAGWSVLGVLP